MLGINVALGFAKQHVWITFAKDLAEVLGWPAASRSVSL